MNRRKFLKLSGSITAGLTVSGFGYSKHFHEKSLSIQPAAAKPNILYIMTDQQFAGAMSCAGNQFVHTPAMDSIAENGVLFEKAYCSNPLCVPSRTTMMTGRMPHETGITFNVHPKEDSIRFPLMGKIMSEAGYDCGYVGKWHLPVPTSQDERHGFKTVRHARGNKVDFDADIPTACSEFINQQRETPFLLVASFVNPHDICEWARGDKLKNGDIPEPPPASECPPLPENFEIPPLEPDILRKVMQKNQRTYPTVNWETDRWRQYLWAYYRLIEKVDSHIGALLETLRESGQLENTVIIFTSDHGDGSGAHRWNQKQVLYEESVRVPFIISQKGVTKGGRKDDKHLVSNGQDLLPTLCDYADVAVPAGLSGFSVRDLAEDSHRSDWREFLVAETEFGNFGKSFGVTGRMVRTGRFKYVIYSEGDLREQLFDLEKDPGELLNLVESEMHKRILEEHRNRLIAWCRETNDPFIANLEKIEIY